MIKSAFDMPNIDPKLLPALLAGGAGALAGGTLTAMSPERQGESRGSRRWRILRNALLLGGAGAGGTALLQKGIDSAITNPLPANDKEPFIEKIHDLASGKWGIGAGAAGAGIGIGGQALKEEQNAGNSILGAVNGTDYQQKLPRPAVEAGLASRIGTKGSKGFTALEKGHVREAGINLPRLMSKVNPAANINWKDKGLEDLKLFGSRVTGAGRKAGPWRRGKAVAIAAAIPALAAYLTNQDNQ